MVGIGTNHFIHAARRNLDVLAIMVNNMIYGMTGGQVAPTTPFGTKTTTTPYGSFEQPLDAAKLAVVAGASYSARWTTAHIVELKESIKNALQMNGFRFLEVLSQCPTAYGRMAGFRNAGEMLRWFKKNAVTLKQAAKMREEELEGRTIIGEFQQRDRPSIVENVYAAIKEAQANAKKDRD